MRWLLRLALQRLITQLLQNFAHWQCCLPRPPLPRWLKRTIASWSVCGRDATLTHSASRMWDLHWRTMRTHQCSSVCITKQILRSFESNTSCTLPGYVSRSTRLQDVSVTIRTSSSQCFSALRTSWARKWQRELRLASKGLFAGKMLFRFRPQWLSGLMKVQSIVNDKVGSLADKAKAGS